jgi:hypothetical protein
MQSVAHEANPIEIPGDSSMKTKALEREKAFFRLAMSVQVSQ